MLVSILRYLKGYLKIRIIGYSPERFINLCSHHRIYLWGLSPSSHAYEMYISVKGFRRLKPIIRKTKTKVVIMDKYGLPFFLHKYRKRKLFFIGAFLCICSVYIMSLFIWNIHIEGNYTRTDENILEFLETEQIKHGMPKSKVDCSRIVKDIRKEFDDIIWVSASIKGTRLFIQVKENSDTILETQETSAEHNDIVADKDGTIVKIITRNGVPQVHEGDNVKAGDILVSGRVEVLNDSKEVTGYQYQTSDADILAQTTASYSDEMPLTYTQKEYSGIEKQYYYLKFGNYVWSLGNLKNRYEEADRTTKEKQLKIGEHFYLPVSYGKTTVRQYISEELPYSDKAIQEKLTEKLNQYCIELEKQGIQIKENNVQIIKTKDCVKAQGTLTLIEPIGKAQKTEIVELPTKENDDRIDNE